MDLLDPPQTPTKEEQIAAAKRSIDATVVQLFQQMQAIYVTNFDRVWGGKGYTPAEILALYGTKAGRLFELSALLRDTIETAKPGTLPADKKIPPVAVSFSTDGTVTIGS